jgi:hypothetical protein
MTSRRVWLAVSKFLGMVNAPLSTFDLSCTLFEILRIDTCKRIGVNVYRTRGNGNRSFVASL